MQGSNFDSFEKVRKHQNRFDDGTSKKANRNSKKSSFSQRKPKSPSHF